MLDLPEETEINGEIHQSKLFQYALQNAGIRSKYRSQIDKIFWRNKLSVDNYLIEADGRFPEVEIFETYTVEKTIDKRLLQAIDKAIPYYIFHVLSWRDQRQALIAEKNMLGNRITVDNYYRSCWMSENQFMFSFQEKTAEKLYKSLQQQVKDKRSKKILLAREIEEGNAFIQYFRTMHMTRSYKPVLMLALLEQGGSITIEKAAEYFIHFYRSRNKKGLQPEFGYCIYADENASLRSVYTNLIRNPVAALCRSGFFRYSENDMTLSILPEIYDALTINEIDEVIKSCLMRLTEYFNK